MNNTLSAEGFFFFCLEKVSLSPGVLNLTCCMFFKLIILIPPIPDESRCNLSSGTVDDFVYDRACVVKAVFVFGVLCVPSCACSSVSLLCRGFEPTYYSFLHIHLRRSGTPAGSVLPLGLSTVISTLR